MRPEPAGPPRRATEPIGNLAPNGGYLNLPAASVHERGQDRRGLTARRTPDPRYNDSDASPGNAVAAEAVYSPASQVAGPLYGAPALRRRGSCRCARYRPDPQACKRTAIPLGGAGSFADTLGKVSDRLPTVGEAWRVARGPGAVSSGAGAGGAFSQRRRLRPCAFRPPRVPVGNFPSLAIVDNGLVVDSQQEPTSRDPRSIGAAALFRAKQHVLGRAVRDSEGGSQLLGSQHS